MLLTIGMIVRNEEKFLRKCLDGLKLLMDNVKSELIICDTGSTDSTIEIAREYTDKIIEVEWRGDFAWARSHTLKRAKGKWYMFVDADEIFEKEEDVEDIIHFLSSNEHKDYFNATIVLKNVSGPMKLTGSVFNAGRLIRVTKETKFKGKIHEHLTPVYTPIKELKSVLTHYGYDFENDEVKNAKHQRNLIPMLEEIKENPNDLRMLSHLARQYAAMNEHDEALMYVERGLEQHDITSDNVYYHALYQQMMEYYLTKKEYEKVIEVSTRYFNEANLKANAQYVKNIETTAYFSLGKYEEAAKSSIETYEYMEKNERNELDRYVLSVVMTIEMHKPQILGIIIGYNTVAGNFDTAVEWINKSDNKAVIDSDIYNIYINHHVKKSPEKISVMYDYVVGKYGIRSTEYDNALAAIERNITDNEIKFKIAESLVDGREDFGDGYIRLQHMRIKIHEGDYTANEELNYFINSNEPLSQQFGDIIIAAVNNNIDIVPIIEKMRITNTSEFINVTFKNTTGFSYALLNYINDNNFINECNSLKTLRIVASILSLLSEIESGAKFRESIDVEESVLNAVILNTAIEAMTESNMEIQLKLFESYTRIKHKYLKLVYRDNVYCEDKVNSIPEQDAFTFYSGRAFECKDGDDTAGYVHNLRLALNILPGMIDLIKNLCESINEEISTPVVTVHDQLSRETDRLKTIIYTMINTGNITQAEQILNNYEKINPSDPEIGRIKGIMKIY